MEYNIKIIKEALSLLEKCKNLQPREYSHKEDYVKLESLISKLNDFNSYYESKKYDKAEEVGTAILEKSPEFKDIKLKYIETKIKLNKFQETLTYIEKNVSSEERFEDEYQYLICLTLYYQGS